MSDASDNRPPTRATEAGTADPSAAGKTSGDDATVVAREQASTNTDRSVEEATAENRERLGVDAEHKTESMRKHRRGTFP